MTDKQFEALQLADCLERMSLSTQWDKKAAAELRRLDALNAELVEALQLLTITCENVHHAKKDRHSIEVECPVVARINALKAQGENND